MSTRRPRRTTPAAVVRLAERIAQWRRTRARRTAMPAELWSAATGLAAEHGVYRVARGLRVNFETLRRRVVETHGAAAARRETSPALVPGGFVEVTPALMATEPPPGLVVEVVDAAGARLTLRWASVMALDAAAIVAAFRRGSA